MRSATYSRDGSPPKIQTAAINASEVQNLKHSDTSDGGVATSIGVRERRPYSARQFASQVISAVSMHVESRKGARPGTSVSRWFPFPAHQTGRAQLEHPAFRLVSPQRPRKRSDTTAPCDGTPVTLPSRCDNSWIGNIRNHSGFQTFVNDRSVALSPAHQKQGPFPPPTLLGLHGVGSEVARLRAGHRPPLKLYMQFSRIQLSRRLTLYARCTPV